MATEIERKYLVVNAQWQTKVIKKSVYKQGYMNTGRACSIRVRVSENDAHLNIKSATLGVTRSEYDYPIPPADANEMLAAFCDGPLIEKTRYYVKEDDAFVWEVDVFGGENQGLILAEIELESEDQVFIKPDWLGKEVSDDPRYYNVCLVSHPFQDWREGR